MIFEQCYYNVLIDVDMRLGYHQSEAWLVEQKALPPQLYVASVTTGIRTHTLLINSLAMTNCMPICAY